MKRKSTATATAALDSQLGRAMRKVLEQMEKSEESGEKSEGREAEDYLRGGKVRGPGTATSDSILARISNGEYVLPKPAVDMVGVNNLEAIRRAALARTPGYALGGLAFGGSGLNSQTPSEYTATTFSPSTTVNPMTPGTAIGGGMRQSSAQPTGPTNQYGNDMSLTNRMNAGADQLRAMRTGTATTEPTPQQPDFMTGLKSLLNSRQQDQDVYKAARGLADVLDVASGRFDREYAPEFKYGGMVSKKQWEGLPRFRDGDWVGMSESMRKAREDSGNNVPMLKPAVQSALQGLGQWLTAPSDTSRMPGSQLPRFNQPRNAPVAPLQTVPAPASSGFTDQDLGAGPGMGAVQPLPPRQPMAERWSALTAPASKNSPAVPIRSLAGTSPNSNIPFPIPTEVAERGQRNAQMAGLMEEGFGLLSQQPGTRDAISGGLNLGPNNILVRERLGTPEDYTAALQARKAAMARGQAAGLPQSVIGGDYRPSEATRMSAERGGPITEYAVPGKGTATFLGERRGGGTLSVVSGRTPEEQALIDQRVAGINSQTAALRGLRNAQRQDQGLPTVEQSADQAAMQSMMPAPPSTHDLDLQEAELMRQLQGVGDIRGLGSRRRRADAIQAAQAGLSAIANQRQALNQGYQAQLAQAQGLMGLQATQREKEAERLQAQQAAEQAQQRWGEEFKFKRTKAQVDAMEKDRKYLMDALKATPDLDDDAMLKIRERFMRDVPPTKENPTGGKAFNEQEFRGALGVETFTGNTQPRAGKVYYKEDENAYMLATPEGLVEIGGPDEFLRYRHRQIQQQQRSALLGAGR